MYARVCFCVCVVGSFVLFSLTGSPRGAGAKDFNICKESRPIAKGESPTAAAMLKTVMVFPARLGVEISVGHHAQGHRALSFN